MLGVGIGDSGRRRRLDHYLRQHPDEKLRLTDVYKGKDIELSVAELQEMEREEDAAADMAAGWTAAPPGGHSGRLISLDIEVSDFAQKAICYDTNKKISFKTRPWLYRVYDSEYTRTRLDDNGHPEAPVRRTLLMTARQTEKTTSLGNKILTNCFLTAGMRALYVTSAGLNMKEFADERVNNPLRVSPMLKKWSGNALVDNKFTKRWANNSRLVLRSAHLDASRVRGIPADLIAIDEIQDFLPETIPVILACANNSVLPMGPIFIFAGTPLTFDNIIERTWSQNSTQNVWLTRCGGCRKWNPPYPAQVGKYGMICERCGKSLDPLNDGQWVRMKENIENVAYEGFHLSRILMAYTVAHDRTLFRSRWSNFLKDYNDPTMNEAQRMNEHFGLSFDSGKKPITRDQLIACSHPGLEMTRIIPDTIRMDPTWPIFAGIDWGEGSEDGAYTVITLGYMNGDMFEVAYAKRYMGREADPKYVKMDIAELLTVNRVDMCFCDAGMGWGMIDSIREMVPDGLRRIVPVRYSGNQSQVITYDEKGHMFVVHRTRWMSKIFNMLIRGQTSGGVRLPRWKEFETPFGEDILNIFADRSPKLKQMSYSHSGTDDGFHSLLYALTAQKWWMGDIDVFVNA